MVRHGRKYLPRVAWGLFVVFAPFAFAQLSSNAFVYEGRLYDAAGNPITSVATTFRLGIYSPGASCLLYEETHSPNLGSTAAHEQGVFALKVGLGARTGNDGGANFYDIFKNTGTHNGGGGCTYTPGPTDARLLRVQVNTGGGEETLSPDLDIVSSPTAMVAHSLQGKSASDFLQVTGNVTPANMALLTGGSDASTLHHHDGRYARLGGSAQQDFGTGNIVTAGQIAVGTASPTAGVELHVKDSTGVATVKIESPAAQGSKIQFADTALAEHAAIVSEGGTSNLVFSTGGTTAMKIDAAQNVSIMGSLSLGGMFRPGQITAAQEVTLTSVMTGCGAPCSGGTWYRVDSGQYRLWDNTKGIRTIAAYTGSPLADQVLTWNNVAAVWEPKNVPSSLDNSKLSLSGGVMTGPLTVPMISTSSIGVSSLAATNLSAAAVSAGAVTVSSLTVSLAPSASLDGVNKIYADTHLASRSIASAPVSGNNGDSLVWSQGTGQWIYVAPLSIGSTAGRAMAANAVPNCTAGEKLQMSVGPTFSWSCVSDNSGIAGVSSANSYLTVSSATLLTVNVGTAAGTLAAGNDSRFAQYVMLDGSRAMTGALSLVSGPPVNIQDASHKGYVDSAISAAASNYLRKDGTVLLTADWNVGGHKLANVGSIELASQNNIHFGGYDNVQEGAMGLSSADRGRIWYNSQTNEIKYWNGSAAVALGISGFGVSSFNGETGAAQSLAVTIAAGARPSWSSASSKHELRIPMASGIGTDGGLISYMDYAKFSDKLDRLGGSMSGALTLAADPTAALGAATKQYVDSATSSLASHYVRLDGTRTLTNNWTVGWFRITGITVPLNPTDATSKIYADSFLASRTIASGTPTNNDVLVWNTMNSRWQYVGLTGAITAGGDVVGPIGSVTIGPNAVKSNQILDGTIVDADISGSAAIAMSKIAGLGSITINGNGSLYLGSITVAGLGTFGGLSVSGAARLGSVTIASGISGPVTVNNSSGSDGLIVNNTNGGGILISAASSGSYLTLADAANFGSIRMDSNDLSIFNETTSGSLHFGTQNAAKATMMPDGSFGIGTINPTRLLHVNGPMRVTASVLPGAPATGDIAVDSGDGNRLKWYDGSTWQKPDFYKRVQIAAATANLTISHNGQTLNYVYNGAGSINLPYLSSIADGYSVTVVRQNSMALYIMSQGTEYIGSTRSSSFSMAGNNLVSATFTKVNTGWSVTNTVSDCTVGRACWADNHIFAGTYNGRQYFTTPGGCNNSTTPTCASTDSLMLSWHNPGTVDINADDPYDGTANSTTLLATGLSTAANFCENMIYAGFSDWYLPSRHELYLLFQNSGSIGQFNSMTATSWYHSSTEAAASSAFAVNFMSGAIQGQTKSSNYYVRCVRRVL